MLRLLSPILFVSVAVTLVHAAVFNVRDYGAKGDGITDDSAAITSAAQAMITADAGGNLYFPAGQYFVAPSPRSTPLIQLTNSDSSATARYSITGDAWQSTSIMAPNQQASLIVAAPGAGVDHILVDITGISINFFMAAGASDESDASTDAPRVAAIDLHGVDQSTIDSIKISASAPSTTPFNALHIGSNCTNLLVEDSQLNVQIQGASLSGASATAAVRVSANTDQIQLNRLNIWSDTTSNVNGIEIDRSSGLTEINLPIFTNILKAAALLSVDESQEKTTSSPTTVLIGGAVAKNVSTCVNLLHPLFVNITKSNFNCIDYGLALSSADGLIVRLDTSKVFAATAILQSSGELSLFSNQISHSSIGVYVDLEAPWNQHASLFAQSNTFQATTSSGIDVNLAGIGLTDISLVNNQCLDTNNGQIQGSGSCAVSGCTISGNQGCTVSTAAVIAEY